ncbi:MAG: hypothetical protein RR800_00420 [Comamonas sp.]
MPIELLPVLLKCIWSAYDLAIESGQRQHPPPGCTPLSHPLLPGAIRIELAHPRAYVHGLLMTLGNQLHTEMLQQAKKQASA